MTLTAERKAEWAGGKSGGLRDGWGVRNEVMVQARCLLQILERNYMTLNRMEINHGNKRAMWDGDICTHKTG